MARKPRDEAPAAAAANDGADGAAPDDSAAGTVAEEQVKQQPQKNKKQAAAQATASDAGKQDSDEGDDEDDEDDEEEEPESLIVTGSRTHKQVERLAVTDFRQSGAIEIVPGPGTKLEDIADVQTHLAAVKDKTVLPKLHQLVFGKTAKPAVAKTNLLQYSGRELNDADRKRFIGRVEHQSLAALKQLLDALGVDRSYKKTKDEFVQLLASFLEKPTAAAVKGGKPKTPAKRTKAASSKSSTKSKSSKSPSKAKAAKKPRKATEPESEEEEDDDDDDEGDSDAESEDSDNDDEEWDGTGKRKSSGKRKSRGKSGGKRKADEESDADTKQSESAAEADEEATFGLPDNIIACVKQIISKADLSELKVKALFTQVEEQLSLQLTSEQKQSIKQFLSAQFA